MDSFTSIQGLSYEEKAESYEKIIEKAFMMGFLTGEQKKFYFGLSLANRNGYSSIENSTFSECSSTLSFSDDSLNLAPHNSKYSPMCTLYDEREKIRYQSYPRDNPNCSKPVFATQRRQNPSVPRLQNEQMTNDNIISEVDDGDISLPCPRCLKIESDWAKSNNQKRHHLRTTCEYQRLHQINGQRYNEPIKNANGIPMLKKFQYTTEPQRIGDFAREDEESDICVGFEIRGAKPKIAEYLKNGDAVCTECIKNYKNHQWDETPVPRSLRARIPQRNRKSRLFKNRENENPANRGFQIVKIPRNFDCSKRRASRRRRRYPASVIIVPERQCKVYKQIKKAASDRKARTRFEPDEPFDCVCGFRRTQEGIEETLVQGFRESSSNCTTSDDSSTSSSILDSETTVSSIALLLISIDDDNKVPDDDGNQQPLVPVDEVQQSLVSDDNVQKPLVPDDDIEQSSVTSDSKHQQPKVKKSLSLLKRMKGFVHKVRHN